MKSPEANPGFSTPILLLVFNRPGTTARVFQRIRSVRPRFLYVAGDGPRAEVASEADKCAETRRLATDLDWDCRLHTLFRAEHLGCGLGVSSAISWFFENVKEGIILEDDCVPDSAFFTYCADLLAHYRDEPRVMHIGGSNFQYGRVRGLGSYYFSRYAHVWGWATWRRAWKAYDFDLKPTWELRDTWATQWQLSLDRDNGIAIVPNANLVTNVGFGDEATHTSGGGRFAALPTGVLSFPLRHPDRIEVDRQADILTYYANYRNVRYLRLIPAYRAWDWISGALKSVKRRVLGPTRGAEADG